MGRCKFCDTQVKRLTYGYCHNCYVYFIKNGFDTWYPSQFGELSRVQKENHPQYGWPICHICGKAFSKLQQHIWYMHKMTKIEYCDKYGLDHKINMTSSEYNKKMSEYAYKNNMPDQLKRVGKATRFTRGHNNNYIRSPQTQNRLHKNKFYKKGERRSELKIDDPIRLKLKEAVITDSKLSSNDILRKVLFEADSKYWIYEVSKQDILKSILNKTFENDELQWVYLMIEESDPKYITNLKMYCVTNKNAAKFDLNILYRKEYSHLYKIALFKEYEGFIDNKGRKNMRISADRAFQSYLQYGIFNIMLKDSEIYVNDLKITTYGFPKLSQRNIDIVKLRLQEDKIPYEKIGLHYNLSKQRVAQIYNSTILAIKYRYFYYLTKMKGGM